MNREQIIALLKTLGVKTGEGEGLIKEDDAVKLVEDQFKAGNLGLVQKRDELLAAEKVLKENVAKLEAGAGENIKKQAELEAQLKKANPEEHKKYYEGLAKELADKHAAELNVVVQERDKYRDSHYARVRDDAINTATKDIQFIDGLKDGFIALAMLKNQFKPAEIDGKTIFTNQDNKTIEAVLHELQLSKEGRAYIKNGNSGGGAAGGNPQNIPGAGGGKSMTRGEFASLPDTAKMEFITKGGQVTAT